MRKALIVGINYYPKLGDLFGCANDAHEVKSVIERNGDGTLNFGTKLAVATNEETSISRKELKSLVQELFADKNEIALFYFAGHGYVENTGGYLMTSDCEHGDDGFPMSELLKIANDSESDSKIIILDCCHSGYMGKTTGIPDNSVLSEGMTILTASSESQYATEVNGSGVFTRLLVDALLGGASNLVGEVTPGSVYAHIDQSLGPWQQRPIFKTNVRTFTSLRKVVPPITHEKLSRITELFPEKHHLFALDPSYEPEDKSCIQENVEKFKILQAYNRLNLVIPYEEEHMYFAAINSTGCKLTVLGEHYWNLVKNELL